MALKTSVSLFIFRRPELTQQVFSAIRDARPTRLFVYADGPREGNSDEANQCAAARQIVSHVDWPCDVTYDFSEANLGCRGRLVSGLNALFSQTKDAIILEDDCLPSPDFFRFCESMLLRYRNNTNVMHISGTCPVPPAQRERTSHWFSRYPHIWGWATWARAWAHYDPNIAVWKKATHHERRQLFRTAGICDLRERTWWGTRWDEIISGSLDTWDVQWSLACIIQHALCATPGSNLVSNIGFGKGATHTTSSGHSAAFREVQSLAQNLVSSPEIWHKKMDRIVAIEEYGRTPSFPGVRYYLKRLWADRL